MAVLDNIYRVFMFVLPYALCFAAYVWVGKKAWRVPQKAARIFALVIIGCGLAFTLYQLVRTVPSVFTNDNFQYLSLLITVGTLAIASIVMAIGEPEV